jgi:subtilase family serine protease
MKYLTHIIILASILLATFSVAYSSNAYHEIMIVFRHDDHNIETLKSVVHDISNPRSKNYGKYLSQKEILELVSPPKHLLTPVEKWLFYNGVDLRNIKDYGDAWKVKLDDQTFQRLLRINAKNVPGTKMLVSEQSYIIPRELQYIVQFIGGIFNKDYQKAKRIKKINVKNGNNVDSRYIGREVLCRLYNFDCNYTMRNNISVGAVEYQGSGGFSHSDLYDSQKNNGQQLTNVTTNHTVGPNSGLSTETELDMQMISQAANGNQEWFWDVGGWLYDFAVAYFNAKQSPDITSHSWGWSEDKQCDIIQCGNMTSQQYVQRVNNEYLKLAALGKTLVVAAGDAGAPGRTSETCLVTRPPVNPIMPGSSPYVLSVGATYVVESNNKVNWTTPLCQKQGCTPGMTEREINFEATGWTAGGGFSIYNTRPFWQDEAVETYLNSGVPLPHKFNFSGKAYPDVAVTGHNCPTWMYGGLSGVDGTSCSSPIFAGLLGLLNDYQVSKGKPKLGLAGPLLYLMHSEDPSTFNDITSGNNWCTEAVCCPVREDGGSDYGFVGTCGYDPVTGLGTPNIERMKAWLNKNT